MLALGPGLFAAWKYTERAERNLGREPVAAKEQVSVGPGSATSERDDEEQPAATEDDDGELSVDLGEIGGGESNTYADLLRITNEGTQPLLVYVEALGISEAPLHASPSGEEGPGVFRIEPGEEQSVDLGLAADMASRPEDVDGSLIVRTASGLVERTIPALATVTAPPVEDLISTLLGAASNPEAGIGRIGETSEGMEAPDFVVTGVTEGGVYGADVTFSWEPVGPLTRVSATLNGQPISSEHTVTDEGDYNLHLSGYVLDSSLYTEDISFSVDKTPPEVVLVSSPLQPADAARFAVQATDDSPITGVDLVLIRRDDGSEEPEATPEPTAEPTAEPTTEPTPDPDADEDTGDVEPAPEPTAEPTPEPTTEPTAEPTAEPTVESHDGSGEDPSTQTIRVRAKRDQATGLWVVDTELPTGTFEVYSEARDAAGNVGGSTPQIVRIVEPLHAADELV